MIATPDRSEPLPQGDRAKPIVLIFRTHLLPSSETFILEQARHLQRYRPFFVGLRRVKGLPLPATETMVLSSGDIWGRLSEYAYAWTGVAPSMVRRLRLHKPALIHAHFGPGGTLALPFARALGIPLAVTFHGFDATMSDHALSTRCGYAGRHYVASRKALCDRAVLKIAVSRFIASCLVQQGFNSDDVTVHYIGVDRERFCPRPDGSSEPLVLFVGRLVEKKGCEYLLRAIQQVQSKLPNATLAVIGDGPLRPSLEELARVLGVRVTFLGMQRHEVVIEWLQKARLLCLPSVQAQNGDSEGLGMVILEAQASGLPVIATNHGPFSEVIEDGINGFLVPERDATSLAAALMRGLSDAAWCQAAGHAAQEMVGQRFDIAKQTSSLEVLYDSLCQTPQPIPVSV